MSVSDRPRDQQLPDARGRSRRRVSRGRFMVRRIGALLVIIVLAFGAVRVVSAVLDDGDRAGDAVGAIVTTGANTTPDDALDGGEVTAVTPQTTVEAVAAPGADDGAGDSDEPPSEANPAAVYIVGDSDAGTFGPYLERLLDGTLITQTELNYKVSSGLARPDFFDWPAELATRLPEVDPDIVVVTFGGNDSQGLAVESGEFIIGDPVQNTAEWSEEYERRAGEVMDLLLEEGRTIIWVGIPNDDNPDVTARLAIQDQAVKAAAAARPGIVFVDTWTRFSGRDGGWAEFVIDPRDGQGKDVRASDGFHLNEVGAEILALDIAQAIRDDLRARGAAI